MPTMLADRLSELANWLEDFVICQARTLNRSENESDISIALAAGNALRRSAERAGASRNTRVVLIEGVEAPGAA